LRVQLAHFDLWPKCANCTRKVDRGIFLTNQLLKNLPQIFQRRKITNFVIFRHHLCFAPFLKFVEIDEFQKRGEAKVVTKMHRLFWRFASTYTAKFRQSVLLYTLPKTDEATVIHDATCCARLRALGRLCLVSLRAFRAQKRGPFGPFLELKRAQQTESAAQANLNEPRRRRV